MFDAKYAAVISSEYRFGDYSWHVPVNVRLLPHTTTFDETRFLKLLRASISLSPKVKRNLLAALPNMEQWRIDGVIQVLEKEHAGFRDLCSDHDYRVALSSRERKALDEWKRIEGHEPEPIPLHQVFTERITNTR